MMNNVVDILAEHIVLRVIYVVRYVIRNVFHAALRVHDKQKAV
jgi:hypothetical protein